MTGIYFVMGRISSFTTTSFTPKSFTTSIDLQEPVSVTLKNFLKANWPANGLLQASQIKFGNKWYDSFGNYQIHLVEPDTNEYSVDSTTVGWQVKGVLVRVNIHVFARKNTLLQPPELNFMTRTISSIININRRVLPITIPNSCYMQVVKESESIDRQPLASLWHSVVEANVNFFRANSV